MKQYFVALPRAEVTIRLIKSVNRLLIGGIDLSIKSGPGDMLSFFLRDEDLGDLLVISLYELRSTSDSFGNSQLDEVWTRLTLEVATDLATSSFKEEWGSGLSTYKTSHTWKTEAASALVEELLSRLFPDVNDAVISQTVEPKGLTASKHKNRPPINSETIGKFKLLVAKREECFTRGVDPPSWSDSCKAIKLDRKTAKKHWSELQENWGNSNYRGTETQAKIKEFERQSDGF